MNDKIFDFTAKLESNYDKNPITCYLCGKPLSFRKYYSQYEKSKKFCSKKCLKNYVNEIEDELSNSEKFASKTEKIIYIYLTLQYPDINITYNLREIFPPYEIDFCINSVNGPVYLEYNGSLHCTKKEKGVFKRTVEKHKINDKIKKLEICKNRQQTMIRLWSETGLYSKPKLFNEALKKLKKEIDIQLNSLNYHGKCVEIIVDKNHDFHRFVEDYREN